MGRRLSATLLRFAEPARSPYTSWLMLRVKFFILRRLRYFVAITISFTAAGVRATPLRLLRCLVLIDRRLGD